MLPRGFCRNLLFPPATPAPAPHAPQPVLAPHVACPALASPKGTPVLVDPSVDPLELCLSFWGISPSHCSSAVPAGSLGNRRELGWAHGFALPWHIEREAFLIPICPQGCLPPGDTVITAGRALAPQRWLEVVRKKHNPLSKVFSQQGRWP